MTKIMAATPTIEKALVTLKSRCRDLKKNKDIQPLMKVVQVGNHRPSLLYVRNKKRFCEQWGGQCQVINLPVKVSEGEFCHVMKEIAQDSTVHGCFVQLPLPDHLQHIDVGRLIPPDKDVDGLSAENFFRLLQGDRGEQAFLPCTAKGIISLLQHYGVKIASAHVAIVGRSMIVGKPLALLMNNYDATVTLCHSKTRHLRDVAKTADILVVAIGIPQFIDATYISAEKRPYVIDVGINYDAKGLLCGDVNFTQVLPKVSGLTPVPKGVGPMTVLSLSQNLLQAAENAHA